MVEGILMLEGVLMLLSGLFCLLGARYWLRMRRQVDRWPVVRGRMMERKAIQPTDRGRTSAPAFRWSPEVRFAYQVGNTDYVGDKIWLPWTWTNTKGKAHAILAAIPDEVDVHYDPMDPKTSCLFSPAFSNVVWYAIPGVLLLGMGALWTVVNALSMI